MLLNKPLFVDYMSVQDLILTRFLHPQSHEKRALTEQIEKFISEL